MLSIECGDLELPVAFYSHQLLQDKVRQNWKALALLCDFVFNFLNPWQN